MKYPHNQPSLLGQNVHGTKIALTSSGPGPNYSENNTFKNNHALVEATLSNSATTFPSQNQAFPVLNQPAFHQCMGESRNMNSNPILPYGFHAHRKSEPYTMGIQNTVNLNFIMESSSSMNVNLFNSRSYYQMARNNPFAPSSNIPLVRNNAYNPASANFQQQPLNLASHQQPMVNRILEKHECFQFIRHYSRFVSSTISTTSTMFQSTLESQMAIPCPSQNTINVSSLQEHPSNSPPIIFCQNHVSFHSGVDLVSTNHPSRYSPVENHTHLPGFPSLTPNPTTNQVLAANGGHGILHKNSVHTRPNFHTLESLPIKDGKNKSKEDHEPNSNHNPPPQPANLQVPDPQARKCQRSHMRYKSHPYKKHGPYTCPRCHVIFYDVHRYAAHYKSHYKDETVAEKKKRLDYKIKNKDLHIARCMDGITVMPGSSQLEDKPLVATDVSDGNITLAIKEEVIIKEEAINQN